MNNSRKRTIAYILKDFLILRNIRELLHRFLICLFIATSANKAMAKGSSGGAGGGVQPGSVGDINGGNYGSIWIPIGFVLLFVSVMIWIKLHEE